MSHSPALRCAGELCYSVFISHRSVPISNTPISLGVLSYIMYSRRSSIGTGSILSDSCCRPFSTSHVLSCLSCRCLVSTPLPTLLAGEFLLSLVPAELADGANSKRWRRGPLGAGILLPPSSKLCSSPTSHLFPPSRVFSPSCTFRFLSFLSQVCHSVFSP